jgi:guanidinopropionase
MVQKDIPMVAGRKSALAKIYGDTPSFIGCPIITKEGMKDVDIAIFGVPWEGTITWGSYSGCELAPKSIRHVAARYGGFLPEYNINLLDYLKLGDFGDVDVSPSDPGETMERVRIKASDVYQGNAIPFVLGGDHSFTPAIMKALSERITGKIGIIHFDSHLDNVKNFATDEFPRCGPLYRVAQIPQVKKSSIVHFGIRGPRNAPSQAEYAKGIGAKVLTIKDVHELGMEKAIDQAAQIAYDGTDAVYITICSDIFDAAYNPGGPADFDGLTPRELFYSLFTLGQKGIAGLDFVEVYPLQDANGVSSHLAAWSLIYGLAGMAMRRKNGLPLLFENKK